MDLSYHSFSQQNIDAMDTLKPYNKNLYPFNSRWTTIDGCLIHYIDEGKGDVLLINHAVVGASFMYREMIKELRMNFRVVIMEFPGFGLSRQSPTYEFSFVSQARVLQKFIQQLGLRNIILIGHDSPSGLLVSAWQPELFKAFVLTDTQIFPTDEYDKIHKLVNMAGGSFFQRFNTLTNFLTWGTMRFGMPTKRFTKAERSEYYKITRGKERRQAAGKILKSLRTERAAMMEIKNAFENTHREKNVLLIFGSKDPLNELGIPTRMQNMFPNSELHFIEKEKHFPHE
jgi:haloalkane dehalogenase